MDLQLTRNLEQFFRLVDRWPIKLQDSIECHWPPYGLLLECRQGRLLMTTWRLDNPTKELKTSLSRWYPEAFSGQIQRLFIVKQRLMISCLCPSRSDAHDWYRLYLMQQKCLHKLLLGDRS